MKPGFSIHPDKVGQKKVESSKGGNVEANEPVEVAKEARPFAVLLDEIIKGYNNQLRSNLAIWLKGLKFIEAEKMLYIQVDTKMQESEIVTEKPNILYHFRHGMAMLDLDLKVELKEVDWEAMAAQRSLTAVDKINLMKAKQPLIEEWMRHFDLKVD